jgi:ESS family glutamate:Na+ symporter
MNAPFDMSYFLAFGFIGICIFAGVLLRAKIRFLQNFLVPACMIGGIIGMILLNLELIPLKMEYFQIIAYHFFIISFISIGLTGARKKPGDKGRGKEVARGALWMGLINGASMASQALIGCLLILFLGLIGLGTPLQFGLFLPLGFTQGPGQALAVGKAWEASGFTDAVSIGLAFAAIGFFFALFVGIPIVNWGIRRGLTKLGRGELPDYFRSGVYAEDQVNEPTGMMTTHSGNVDALAFQGGAVGICYLLTYLAYYGIEQIIGTLSAATWGFFFFYGMLMGIFVRLVMQKAGVGYLLNPQTQNRITSFGVDILVAATLISVKLSVVWEHIVPLVVITLAGGIWTTFYMFYFGRRSGELGFERMCVQYGCNTGTVSTGLLLLRVVDPEFKTSVAFQTGLYSIFAAPLILSAMLVIMYAPKWGLNIYHQMGIFLGLFGLFLILLKVFRLWGKRSW